jgi:uncharacterized protein with FMN-binding domain
VKKTIFVVALSIAGFIAVWRFEPASPAGSAAAAQPPSNVATTQPVEPPSPIPGAAGTTGSTSSAPPSSTSDKATTVTVEGKPQNSRYGTVQVSVTFSGSKITEIRLLQAPISGRGVGALPTLQQEALSAQSADIDTVSGATETSESYKASLQAAIDARGA